MRGPIIVHSDEYANWVFDEHHPTQGRRFVNGLYAVSMNLHDRQGVSGSSPRVVLPRLATVSELQRGRTAEYGIASRSTGTAPLGQGQPTAQRQPPPQRPPPLSARPAVRYLPEPLPQTSNDQAIRSRTPRPTSISPHGTPLSVSA